MNCKDCQFFSGDSDAGLCHGKPPTPFVIMQQGFGGPDPIPGVLSGRPEVKADDLACSLFVQDFKKATGRVLKG